MKEGHAWAVIYIGTNFTVDLYNRICSISDCSANVFDNHPVTDNVINGSTIHIQYDLTGKSLATLPHSICMLLVGYRMFLSSLVSF